MGSQTAAEEEFIYTDAFVGENSWNGRERNRLLLQADDHGFVEAAPAFGLDDLRDGRGLAAADFDRDGDVDLCVNNYRAAAALHVNTFAQERSWLAVRLEGTRSNRDAIGAVVRVRTGDVTQSSVVGAGHGYAAQYSKEQLFGLGDAERVDSVEVRWPTGDVERFGGSDARRRLRLVEGEGLPGPAPAPAGADASDGGTPGGDAGADEAGGDSSVRWVPMAAMLGLALGAVFGLVVRRRREAGAETPPE